MHTLCALTSCVCYSGLGWGGGSVWNVHFHLHYVKSLMLRCKAVGAQCTNRLDATLQLGGGLVGWHVHFHLHWDTSLMLHCSIVCVYSLRLDATWSLMLWDCRLKDDCRAAQKKHESCIGKRFFLVCYIYRQCLVDCWLTETSLELGFKGTEGPKTCAFPDG